MATYPRDIKYNGNGWYTVKGVKVYGMKKVMELLGREQVMFEIVKKECRHNWEQNIDKMYIDCIICGERHNTGRLVNALQNKTEKLQDDLKELNHTNEELFKQVDERNKQLQAKQYVNGYFRNLEKENTELQQQLQAEQQAYSELVEKLKGIEWSGHTLETDKKCHVCGEHKIRSEERVRFGHKKDCWISKAIKEDSK